MHRLIALSGFAAFLALVSGSIAFAGGGGGDDVENYTLGEAIHCEAVSVSYADPSSLESPADAKKLEAFQDEVKMWGGKMRVSFMTYVWQKGKVADLSVLQEASVSGLQYRLFARPRPRVDSKTGAFVYAGVTPESSPTGVLSVRFSRKSSADLTEMRVYSGSTNVLLVQSQLKCVDLHPQAVDNG
jgi:hypothetical protein